MRSTTRMRLEDCAAVATGQTRFYVLTNNGQRRSILGRVVDVAPHITCAAFAVHEAINEPGWCVSDTDSGARAGFSLVSEADAVSLAAGALALRTDADVRRARETLRERMAEKAGA
jgi:hypothetical protein